MPIDNDLYVAGVDFENSSISVSNEPQPNLRRQQQAVNNLNSRIAENQIRLGRDRIWEGRQVVFPSEQLTNYQIGQRLTMDDTADASQVPQYSSSDVSNFNEALSEYYRPILNEILNAEDATSYGWLRSEGQKVKLKTGDLRELYDLKTMKRGRHGVEGVSEGSS